MSATLIAVVFALALGHLAPGFAAAVRRYEPFAVWLRWLSARIGERARGWTVPLAVLPPLALIGALQYLLHSPLAGAFGLLLAIAALFYAWGPRDLDTDVAAVIHAPDSDARRAAVARLGPVTASGLGESAQLVEGVFASALRRWFGVLFWFLPLGAAGALLYRLAAEAAEDAGAESLPVPVREGARRLVALLNWPVAQAVTFSLALVANFDTVLGAWREHGGSAARLEHAHLGAAARASVRCEVAEEAQELIEEGASPGTAWVQLGEMPELRDAMSLVWRILLLWLAILALFVVAGWVS
jgi:AmpE protein